MWGKRGRKLPVVANHCSEDNIREYLHNLGAGKDFLNSTQEAQTLKENNDKSDYIKIKIFLSSKENINTDKMKPKWGIFF